jgi:hypothetical protein
MRKTTATPTPMPAFAPDDRPDEAMLALVLRDGSNALFVVVGDEAAGDTTALVVTVGTVEVVKAAVIVYVSLERLVTEVVIALTVCPRELVKVLWCLGR